MSQFTGNRFEAVFISDLHLGWGRVSEEPVIGFLQTLQTRKLYLVGDVFEWLYRRSGWIGNEMEKFVVAINRLIQNGAHVTLISGNHDPNIIGAGLEANWLTSKFPQVDRRPYAFHWSRNGQKYLVIHGDLYDYQFHKSPSWKEAFAEYSYPAYLWFQNRFPELNFSRWMRKFKDEDALMRRHISDFKQLMCKLAREYGCDGVICGHIHFPEQCSFFETEYFNCGDWLEYRSFVGELADGQEGIRLLNAISAEG